MKATPKAEYQKKIDEARGTLFQLVDHWCGKPKAEIILESCDLSVVNTIELLMYIGRDLEYRGRRKPAQKPLDMFISYAKYLDPYSRNKNKKIVIETILGKIHYQRYLLKAIQILRIKNWDTEVYL